MGATGNGNGNSSVISVVEVKERKAEGVIKDVKVRYADGHVAVFCPKIPEGEKNDPIFRRLVLFNDEMPVCVYNGHLGIEKISRSNGIERMSPGYTQQRVASYWDAARSHLYRHCYRPARESGREPDDLPWLLIYHQGLSDLGRLREGEASYLKTAKKPA